MRAFADWLGSTSLSNAIQSISWIIPLLQSIHILMIGVVFISILMITLRILGVAGAEQSFDNIVRRFLPWVRGGVAVMLVTGVILTIAEPVRELYSFSFRLKMALIVLAAGSAIAFLRLAAPAAATAGAGGSLGHEFGPAAKAGAIATVALWLFIIFLGRAIAYDVEVWGALSPHAAG